MKPENYGIATPPLLFLAEAEDLHLARAAERAIVNRDLVLRPYQPMFFIRG